MEHALSEEAQRETAVLRSKLKDLLIAAWDVKFKHVAVDAAATTHNVEYAHLNRWTKWLMACDAKARETYLKKWHSATADTIAAVAQTYADEYMKSAATWDSRLEKWRARFAEDALQDRDPAGAPDFRRRG